MDFWNPTADTVINTVGKAWVQDNQSKFLWPRLPLCRVNSFRGGWSGATTIKLPKLETFLNSQMQPWLPGQPRPQARETSTSDFTIRGRGHAPIPVAFPDGLTGPQRLLWYNQRMPGILSEMWIGMDKALATFLTSTANFGAAKTFTGGPLQNPTLWATQNPINDLLTQTQAIRVYKDSTRFKFVAILDRFVTDVLRQHPSITGAAYTDGATAVSGAGVSAAVDDAALISKLRSLVGFEEIYIGESSANVAVPGATADIESTTNGLLWTGLVTRQQEADLRDPMLEDFPDGAFTLAIGRVPTVEENVAKREAVLFVDGSVEYAWNKIRGETFGCFWDSTTIFT